MAIMNVPDLSCRGAGWLPCRDTAGGLLRGGDVASRDVAPSGMVGRVLAATGKGGTPLLDWLAAWGTAAVIDGLIEAVSIDGGETAVPADGARAALVRVDAVVRALGAAAAGALAIRISVTMEGAVPVVHVVEAPVGRLGGGLVTRGIRLAPSKPAAVRPDAASAEIGWMEPALGVEQTFPTECLA